MANIIKLSFNDRTITPQDYHDMMGRLDKETLSF